MRPITVLLGIIMGSTVSLALCLFLVWVVILLLPSNMQQFAPEYATLLKAVAVFTLFAVASSASFYGEVRRDSDQRRPAEVTPAEPQGRRRWRQLSHVATLLMIAVTLAIYWPR
jgi:hypothetical protein